MGWTQLLAAGSRKVGSIGIGGKAMSVGVAIG
jgi:hypothetical protein